MEFVKFQDISERKKIAKNAKVGGELIKYGVHSEIFLWAATTSILLKNGIRGIRSFRNASLKFLKNLGLAYFT